MMAGGNLNANHLYRYNRYSSISGQFAFNVLSLGDGLLEMKLKALEKENLLSIIASPRLVASHQQPASIQQGTEIPMSPVMTRKHTYNLKMLFWVWMLPPRLCVMKN